MSPGAPEEDAGHPPVLRGSRRGIRRGTDVSPGAPGYWTPDRGPTVCGGAGRGKDPAVRFASEGPPWPVVRSFGAGVGVGPSRRPTPISGRSQYARNPGSPGLTSRNLPGLLRCSGIPALASWRRGASPPGFRGTRGWSGRRASPGVPVLRRSGMPRASALRPRMGRVCRCSGGPTRRCPHPRRAGAPRYSGAPAGSVLRFIFRLVGRPGVPEYSVTQLLTILELRFWI